MKEESATDEEERDRKRAEWAESRRRRRLLRCGDVCDLGETEVSAAKIWRRSEAEEPAPVSQNQSPSRRTAAPPESAMLQR